MWYMSEWIWVCFLCSVLDLSGKAKKLDWKSYTCIEFLFSAEKEGKTLWLQVVKLKTFFTYGNLSILYLFKSELCLYCIWTLSTVIINISCCWGGSYKVFQVSSLSVSLHPNIFPVVGGVHGEQGKICWNHFCREAHLWSSRCQCGCLPSLQRINIWYLFQSCFWLSARGKNIS